MKLLVVGLLCFAQASSASTERAFLAIKHLRDRVEFVDLSPEGRMVTRGGQLVTGGLDGVFNGFIFNGFALRPWAQTALSFYGVFSVGATALGLVMAGSGKLIQVISPRPSVVTDPTQYASAAGLNQFMRLNFKQQCAEVERSPELAAYLIKLDEAYAYAKSYGLL